MDTNFESIKSLIELLVKKAGFSLNEKTADKEYNEVKKLINKYNSNINSDIYKYISEQKKHWESNSEFVGSNLLDAYNSGKQENQINNELSILIKNALQEENKKVSTTLMSYIYNSISTNEEKLNFIIEKINSCDYIDDEERTSDLREKEYLEKKVSELNDEERILLSYITTLKSAIENDKAISTRISDNIFKIKCKIKALEEAKEKIKNLYIPIAYQERLITTISKYYLKLELLEKEVGKIEKEIKNNDSKIIEINDKIVSIQNDKNKVEELLSKTKELINSNEYIDISTKIIDEIKREIVIYTLNILKNQKEVIYVDVVQIEKEIREEWNKKKYKKDVVVKTTEKVKKKETIVKQSEIKNKNDIKTTEKIDLDW